MSSVLTEEEEKAKNLGKTKNKHEVMIVDLEGKTAHLSKPHLPHLNDSLSLYHLTSQPAP